MSLMDRAERSQAAELLDQIYESESVTGPDGRVVRGIGSAVRRHEVDALADLVRDEALTSTLETGMAYALSTLGIAGAHAERGSGRHVAIDPFQSTTWRSIGAHNVEQAGLDSYVTVLEERADEALPRLVETGLELDLAFLDGSHLFDYALIDFFYVDRMLRDGGYVVFHDAWLPSVSDAIAYVLANREYDRHARSDDEFVVLRKRGGDFARGWDDHVAFAAPAAAPLPPKEEVADAPVRAARTSIPAPARPAISFCLATRGNPQRVQNLLSVLRPHVDEIVLAVDAGGDPDVLDAAAPLADRRLTFELRDSASWATGWILNECSGEWILRLDDDEIPSVELLDALPELTSDRRPTLLELRRRWLYPERDRYIASAPWGEEWQSRLLRNVRGNWRFDGRVHTDVGVIGESRLVDLAFYHADLLLQDQGQRREKSVTYETLRPGLEYNDYPVNGLYLPELATPLETAPLPAADAELVEAVLEGAVRPPSDLPAAAVEHFDERSVGRWNQQRETSRGMYRARIEFTQPACRVLAGGNRVHELRVTNLGDEVWPAGADSPPLVRLGYRWREADSGRVVFDGRIFFTEAILPGQSSIVRLGARTPATPGHYRLEVDLVHEHVRWFGRAATLDVVVEERPLVPLLSMPLSERLERDREHARLRAELERAHAALHDFRGTRRYRLAQAAAAPIELVRRRGRRRPQES